jgi:hypothetical protein
MNISVTISGSTIGELQKNLAAALAGLEGVAAEERSEITVGDLKKPKRGRPPKVKADADEMADLDEEDTEESDDDENDAGESDEEEESEDEAEEESEDEEAEGLSEKELTKLKSALKAYSAKHGKEKAVKHLHKFAKVSQDVKPADLPKLLKLLKV